MGNVVFYKPFSDASNKKALLKKLRGKRGYDNQKIDKHINMIEKGIRGEKELNYYLTNVERNIYCLHNIKLKVEDKTSQYDFIVLTNDCIWVLESKSLKGKIFINSEGKINRAEEGYVRYPLTQAEIQVKNLKEFLLKRKLISDDIEIKYKVVFTDKTSNVSYENDEIKKHFIDVELISTIFEEHKETKLDEQEIHKISEALIKNNQPETPLNHEDFKLKKVKKSKERHRSSKANYIVLIVFFLGLYTFAFNIFDKTNELVNNAFNNINFENTLNKTPEEIALGNQLFISKELTKPYDKLSENYQEVEQAWEVMLISDKLNKDEIIELLKTNYSDRYDYAKVIITTSKELFDYYNKMIISLISSPENLEELEREHLIGHYSKNVCFKDEDDYGYDRILFTQKTGEFEDLYNQYVDVN